MYMPVNEFFTINKGDKPGVTADQLNKQLQNFTAKKLLPFVTNNGFNYDPGDAEKIIQTFTTKLLEGIIAKGKGKGEWGGKPLGCFKQFNTNENTPLDVGPAHGLALNLLKDEDENENNTYKYAEGKIQKSDEKPTCAVICEFGSSGLKMILYENVGGKLEKKGGNLSGLLHNDSKLYDKKTNKDIQIQEEGEDGVSIQLDGKVSTIAPAPDPAAPAPAADADADAGADAAAAGAEAGAEAEAGAGAGAPDAAPKIIKFEQFLKDISEKPFTIYLFISQGHLNTGYPKHSKADYETVKTNYKKLVQNFFKQHGGGNIEIVIADDNIHDNIHIGGKEEAKFEFQSLKDRIGENMLSGKTFCASVGGDTTQLMYGTIDSIITEDSYKVSHSTEIWNKGDKIEEFLKGCDDVDNIYFFGSLGFIINDALEYKKNELLKHHLQSAGVMTKTRAPKLFNMGANLRSKVMARLNPVQGQGQSQSGGRTRKKRKTKKTRCRIKKRKQSSRTKKKKRIRRKKKRHTRKKI